MNLSDVLGLAVMAAAIAVCVSLVLLARLDRRLKILLLSGVALHIFGALLYQAVMGNAYGGGDYQLYVKYGQYYAERIHHLDFAMFTDPREWWGGKWTGTQFVFFPAGLIAAIFGGTETLQFIVFALISLLGLLLFGLAFHRVRPELAVSNYLRWIVLFPSLWFWPSAPGKESLIMLGAGMTVLGYCWRDKHINWLVLGAGLLLIFGVRPQVGLVFLAALMLAPWLAAGQAWSFRRLAQGVALGGLAVVGVGFATQDLGMSEPGAAGVSTYVESQGKNYSSGGSDIQTAALSVKGLPTALVTVWLRPFPWEARSVTVLLSVLEISALWGAIALFRRPLVRSFRRWRHDRLLRLAAPFLLFYSVSAGMTMWNLGILARQRILLFPFLFLFFELGAEEVRGSYKLPPR